MTDVQARARAAGWHRFSQIKSFVPHGHKLYRSSAPSYRQPPSGVDPDSTQKLTHEAVESLVEIGIDSIISFNTYAYKRDEVAKLDNAKNPIAYLHLPVEIGSRPTLEQLWQANDFFAGKSSTLVHAGYGLGRTGTGVTALQLCATNGQTLEPLASTWLGGQGNRVEKRRQMSVLAELRNLLLQNRSTGIPSGGPRRQFVIINFATGYYLTISRDNTTIIALSLETVERSLRIKSQYLWDIEDGGVVSNLTLSNSVTLESFALTKSTGATIDDPVTNGEGTDANKVFTITEAATGDRGFYVISPLPTPNLAVAIKEPDDNLRFRDSSEIPVQLAAKDNNNKFGLWILLPVFN